MKQKIDVSLDKWLSSLLEDEELIFWIENVLIELCDIKSFIQKDLKKLADSESKCMDVIERELSKFADDIHIVNRVAISDRIESHEYFTKPNYSNSKRVYKGRSNLTVLPAANPEYRWLLNAHVDVVPPYFPPEKIPDGVKGRGANDNKGGVVTAILVMRLLHSLAENYCLDLRGDVGLTFSIDEEIGGNGSLSLLEEINLEGKSVVVLEPTKLIPHPANRGALWFQIELRTKSEKISGSLHVVASMVIRKLFTKALEIRKNYRHEYFEEGDVQICMGILGSFGDFPASACTEVTFGVHHNLIASSTIAESLSSYLLDVLRHDETICEYAPDSIRSDDVQVYYCDNNTYQVTIRAKGGHMGSKGRGVDALIKFAIIVLHLESKFPACTFWEDNITSLHLEGGQGFLPSMKIDEIKEIILQSCLTVEGHLIDENNLKYEEISIESEFEKIHNEAYCSDPDSQGMNYLLSSIRKFSEKKFDHISGWQASCDARIFALQSNDVITYGAGALELAHGPDEYVTSKDILTAAITICSAIIDRAQYE